MKAKSIVVFLVILAGAMSIAGQTKAKTMGTPADIGHVTASPAFAELALRRAELESELESLLADYTDEFPKVKELKQELEFARREISRLSAIKASDAGRLTSALGKLIVRKLALEIDLWRLEQTYADEHPEVRRAKKRVDIFEKAIKEILG